MSNKNKRRGMIWWAKTLALLCVVFFLGKNYGDCSPNDNAMTIDKEELKSKFRMQNDEIDYSCLGLGFDVKDDEDFADYDLLFLSLCQEEN